MTRRLTGNHIRNIDRAVEDLQYLNYNNEDSLREELKEIIKSDSRLAKLESDIKYLFRVKNALMDVELS